MALTRSQLFAKLGRELRQAIVPSIVRTLIAVILVWFVQGGDNFWSRYLFIFAIPIGGFAGLASALASWGHLVLNEMLLRRNLIPLRLSHAQQVVMSCLAALALALLKNGRRVAVARRRKPELVEKLIALGMGL